MEFPTQDIEKRSLDILKHYELEKVNFFTSVALYLGIIIAVFPPDL